MHSIEEEQACLPSYTNGHSPSRQRSKGCFGTCSRPNRVHRPLCGERADSARSSSHRLCKGKERCGREDVKGADNQGTCHASMIWAPRKWRSMKRSINFHVQQICKFHDMFKRYLESRNSPLLHWRNIGVLSASIFNAVYQATGQNFQIFLSFLRTLRGQMSVLEMCKTCNP